MQIHTLAPRGLHASMQMTTASNREKKRAEESKFIFFHQGLDKSISLLDAQVRTTCYDYEDVCVASPGYH